MVAIENQQQDPESDLHDDIRRQCSILAERLGVSVADVPPPQMLEQIAAAAERIMAERETSLRSLSSLHSHLVELDRLLQHALKDAQDTAAVFRAERDQLVAKLRQAEAAFERIRSSKTWRYTEPLRKVYAWFRNLQFKA